ncbi:MAG: hypothetical protein AMXMBFR64_11080 [Myxococcales bacterium]
MQVQFAARTDVGRVRQHNEDNFLVDRKYQLYIVADGMGGHACGEVASATAVNVIRENILKNREILEEFEQGDPSVTRRDILALLEHSVQHACYRIFEKGLANPRQRGMGTTVSMMLVAGGRGFVAHVGDSRVYLVRQGQVHQLTEDHSLLNELLKHGKVKSLKDIDHRFKNAVTRAVGVYESVEVDTLDFDILPGDRYLLCSDGLTGYTDSEIILQKTKGDDLEKIVEDFITFANAKGGKDNITAIYLTVAEDDKQGDYEHVKLKFETLKGLSLFKYLSYQELVKVMNIAGERTFRPGELIFEEGVAEDVLYILLAGTVDIRKGDVEIAVLKRGVHFGEMSLVDSSPRSATAVARDDVRVLTITRKDFYGVLRKNSTIAVKMLWSFIKALTIRLRRTSDELSKVKSMQASDRMTGEDLMAAWMDVLPPSDISLLTPLPVMDRDSDDLPVVDDLEEITQSGASDPDQVPPDLLPLSAVPAPPRPQPVTEHFRPPAPPAIPKPEP